MSQLWTNKGLTFLPFIPVPQDPENRNDQEDGEESRKPRKDADALVFRSMRKTECQAPAMGGGKVGEDAFFRSLSPRIWNESQVREGRVKWALWWKRVISSWTEENWTQENELSHVNAYWMPGVCM